MASLKFEQFKKIVDEFDEFNIETLKALYSKFDKQIIDRHFDRYYNMIGENEVNEFAQKFLVYFEQKEKDENAMDDIIRKSADDLKTDKMLDDTVYAVCFSNSNCSVMSPDEEKKYGYDLLNGRNNLKIISDIYITVNNGRGIKSHDKEVKIIPLYPKLKLEEIFLSIKDFDDLELLKSIKRLPFSLGDDSVLKDDFNDIKKYLSLCKYGIPSIDVLRKEFPYLDFFGVNIMSTEELRYQLNLLKDYIIARFNYYRRNMKLVFSVAKRTAGKTSLTDAFQMGTPGLIRAIDRFDVSKGNKFSTYASWWIRQAISREIMETSNLIRIPVHMLETVSRYKNFIRDYNMEHCEEPSLQQCAESLGVSLDTLDDIRRSSLDVVSLDSPIGDDEDNDSLDFFVADDSVMIEEQILSEDSVENIVAIIESRLNRNEKIVIYNRYGLNEEQRCMTLEEIGGIISVTRERIRQIEKNALRKIRKALRSMNANKEYFDKYDKIMEEKRKLLVVE